MLSNHQQQHLRHQPSLTSTRDDRNSPLSSPGASPPREHNGLLGQPGPSSPPPSPFEETDRTRERDVALDYTPHSPSTPDPSQPLMNSPRTPFQSIAGNSTTSTRRTPSSTSFGFVSSPLNPRPTPPSDPSYNGYTSSTPPSGSRSRVNSIQHLSRIPSEESTALLNAGPGNRGSMILWKLAGSEDAGSLRSNSPLMPPNKRFNRFSTASDSSMMSYTDDSKYPSARLGSGFVAYSYDPLLDDHSGPKDEVDKLHEDAPGSEKLFDSKSFNWRGFVNVFSLVFLVVGIVCLFTLYPVITFFQRNFFNTLITSNIQINSTGQAPNLPNFPQLVDLDTPDHAKTRTGFDGQEYELVFSDEFNVPNRTFFPGDDPFWEAVDLWYWPTKDLEWYDPRQITTADGKLVLTMEALDPAVNHNLTYRSGMLQSWNKFCFTGGYIEVSLSLPGRNNEAQGYWPGAWTMGNLGRPGYGASTDGTWPYSYDSCDVGTFPNQTTPDKLGPPAALNTPQGRPQYNYELSWLSGQKFSACTCPGEAHPGPDNGVGRGSPEIDILEAQKNKLGDGAKVSQSAQFAPFNANYQAQWDTLTIIDPTITARNSYNGSAVQQAISCLTTLPENIFHGTGAQFQTFGFEYAADPSNRDSGYITWVSSGTESYSMTAATVGADPLTEIGPRLIPEEPMSIIFNLGISTGFQTVDVSTLDFPASFLVDYVRVYQRKGQTNVGCDPASRPTAKYIQDHLAAYTNQNLTTWATSGFPPVKNSKYTGC